MMNNRIVVAIYLTSAILWAISALINAFTSNITICAINIGLSCTCICLGISYLRRDNDNSK